MNNSILKPDTQKFILENIDSNITKMALQKNPFSDIDWILILTQIASKKKAKDKLPTFFNTKNIIYPSKISVEQTSSEKTALYKSKLVSGNNLIDLTGGFGVDDLYFSKTIQNVIHCEINEELSAIVKHNFQQLNAQNITCKTGDSSDILKIENQKFDWIYIDPSRRNEAKGKVFMLKDCLPNVPELLDFYFQFSNKILVKTAPILDISAGLLELKNVKTIHIIALDNEVKELLWEIDNDFSGSVLIKTINITKVDQVFDFDLNSDVGTQNIDFPKKYLYEPNAAIMKSGGFYQVSFFYKLDKLHQHSHLYTSDKNIEFPGRVFEIVNCFDYNKQEMKIHLENKKINITTRNFPESVDNIRKKWKIKDGGNLYCFFTTNANDQKIVLICNKL